MGVIDRTLAAVVRRFSPPATPGGTEPTAQQTADAVENANLLANAASIVSGWMPTGALVNMLTGIGTSRDTTTYNTWREGRPLDQRERYGMGRNALINQVLSKLPNTAMREGWRVDITDERVDTEERGTVSDKIAAYEQRLGIGHKSARAMARGRQYRDALVWLGIDDGRTWDLPVDKANIQTIRWAVVIDARHYQPAELYQADSEHYGEIKTFRITDINGVLEDGLRSGPNSLSYTTTFIDAMRQRSTGGELIVHADRVMHFPTADYLPLLDTLQDAFGAYFEAMYGIRTAARESSTVIYRISNWLSKAWSENAPQALQHMRLVDQIKSTQNAWVVDKEKEDVDVSSRNLGGLADLSNPFMVWLAAATSTPVTIMWGVSPGGFGKGEAERETWHEEARAYFYATAAPQLRKLHGYILVAKDGCLLPFDTQREISINDLSPPDEEVRSRLRTAALNDAAKAFENGGITRDEYRAAISALADDDFRIGLTEEGKRVTKDALVGAITGTVEILKAAGLGEIPAESAEIALARLIPSSFDNEAAASIIAPIRAKQLATATSTATGAVPPGDIEDDTANAEDPNAEPSEVAVAWSNTPPPADAEEASVLAAELRIPTRRVTNAHKAGLIEGWKLLGGKPRYSREEVQRVILQGNGKLPTSEPSEDARAKAIRDGRDPDQLSLVVVARAPADVARWVPYKADDTSAPHVTLLYIGKVDTSKTLAVVDAVRAVLANVAPLTLTFDGVGYFDKDDKRIAYMRIVPTPELQALHDQLRAAVAGLGVSIKHVDTGYIPHLTLAYLAPGEDYDGPMPLRDGWTVEAAELWCDDFALTMPLRTVTTDATEAEPTRDPFPNEHAARQRDPDDFVASTFRRKNIAPGVDIVVGKLKSAPQGGMVVQTYRFDTERFTPAEARAWLERTKADRRALEEAEPARDEGDDFDEAAWLAECEDATEEAKEKRIAEAYKKYHAAVNMGAAELREWAKTPWSKLASVSRAPIDRNLTLLETPREKWTLAHASSALRTVNFVSRMKGAEQGEPTKIDGREGPSKRDISLKNWAFDPRK